MTNRHKGGKLFETGSSRHGYSLISLEDKDGALVKVNGGDDLELAIAQSDILHCEANDEELLLDDLKVRKLASPYLNNKLYAYILKGFFVSLPFYQVSQAMSKIYVKVKPNISVKEAVKLMQDRHQSCVLVVDGEDYLEGIVTFGDIHRHGFFSPTEASVNGGEQPTTPDVIVLFPFSVIVCLLLDVI